MRALAGELVTESSCFLPVSSLSCLFQAQGELMIQQVYTADPVPAWEIIWELCALIFRREEIENRWLLMLFLAQYPISLCSWGRGHTYFLHSLNYSHCYTVPSLKLSGSNPEIFVWIRNTVEIKVQAILCILVEMPARSTTDQ